VDGEVQVGAAASCNDVILEGVDGTFSGVGAVNAGGYELEVDVLVAEELLEGRGALVVKALELGAKASVYKAVVDGLVRFEDGGARLAWHRFDVDRVAVVVVQDEQLRVAGAGRKEKAAHLVGEDLTTRFHGHAGGVAEMRHFAGRFGRWKGSLESLLMSSLRGSKGRSTVGLGVGR
jgi:hypothetical protein